MTAPNLILASIVAGMVAITPDPYKPIDGSEAMSTYYAYADDIYEAVRNPIEKLPFSGPAAQEAAQDALVAIVANESNFRASVRDCRKKGDQGRSISGFQLYRGRSRQGHSEEEICEDHVLAARLGLNILNWYSWAPRLENMFAGYARGTTTTPNYASGQQFKYFQKLTEFHHIRVYRKQGEKGFYAEFIPQPVVASSDAPTWPPPFLPL